MFRQIDLLTAQEVAELREIAATAAFVDGRISNPHSTVKNNLQLHEPGAHERSSAIVAAAFARHEDFASFAMPAYIAPPLLTRYGPGNHYGLHPDWPVMQSPRGPFRSDLSCTVFLSDPDSYDGGALHLQLGSADLSFKGPPGGAIVYPSTTLHEVEPVTAGERLVAITFIQSRVADSVKRELLFELGEVAALEGLSMDPMNYTKLQWVQTNLMRMWMDKP